MTDNAPPPDPDAVQRQGDIPQEDPYPKMILICIGIFVVLLIVILGFLAVDFMARPDRNVRPIPTVESAAPADAPEP